MQNMVVHGGGVRQAGWDPAALFLHEDRHAGAVERVARELGLAGDYRALAQDLFRRLLEGDPPPKGRLGAFWYVNKPQRERRPVLRLNVLAYRTDGRPFLVAGYAYDDRKRIFLPRTLMVKHDSSLFQAAKRQGRWMPLPADFRERVDLGYAAARRAFEASGVLPRTRSKKGRRS